MKFIIGFNRAHKNDTKSFYDYIGAIIADAKDELYYTIEIKDFEELEILYKKVNKKLKNQDFGCDFLINFDPPQIFLEL
jgi:hypothetical protein